MAAEEAVDALGRGACQCFIGLLVSTWGCFFDPTCGRVPRDPILVDRDPPRRGLAELAVDELRQPILRLAPPGKAGTAYPKRLAPVSSATIRCSLIGTIRLYPAAMKPHAMFLACSSWGQTAGQIVHLR